MLRSIILVVAASGSGCTAAKSDCAARVGSTCISDDEAGIRSARRGIGRCEALAELVDENLLARDYCARSKDASACRGRSQEAILADVVAEASTPPSEEDIVKVKRASPYLAFARRDTIVAARLAEDRNARGLLRERARRLRKGTKGTRAKDCPEW